MKRFVRPGAFLLLAALLFCLSGCYSGNIDQYFSLPMASEAVSYTHLTLPTSDLV